MSIVDLINDVRAGYVPLPWCAVSTAIAFAVGLLVAFKIAEKFKAGGGGK